MNEEQFDRLTARAGDAYNRHWRWLLIALWLAYAAYIIIGRWAQIRGFVLSDTDDNLRMAQVRALLAGQDWFDLRQYRFDAAHGGADIHWSRLVDLPIAGLYLLAKPFVGGADAERVATALAPLLPLLLLFTSLALTTRRLVSEKAWALPILGMLSAYSAIGMFAPLRIDHHGWQLAFLALAISGMADPKRARGGAVLGIATGLSLSVGLEMMIYLALLGGATVLLWVADREERRRLAAYAAALVATTGAGFLLFASDANRQAVCDALSPVWVTDAAVGGALMLGLAAIRAEHRRTRFAAAVVAGLVVAGFHALAWPNCLQRLEGVSPEATELWLDHVREARPIYRHEWRVGVVALALPLTALIGWALLLWARWKEGAQGADRLRRTLGVALPAVIATALLFWQTRATPAAQMMALPAATALIVLIGFKLLQSERMIVRLGACALVLLGLGALVPLIITAVPKKEISEARQKVAGANRSCPSLAAMAAVNRQPKGTAFSFIDLGPRLIVLTHHDAIGGPYHRNDKAIADVMKAFRGNEAQARRIIAEYDSDYLLVCPNMSTATIFMAEAPKGFYAQLNKGQVPGWLEPIDLGPDSPFRMWRVKR